MYSNVHGLITFFLAICVTAVKNETLPISLGCLFKLPHAVGLWIHLWTTGVRFSVWRMGLLECLASTRLQKWLILQNGSFPSVLLSHIMLFCFVTNGYTEEHFNVVVWQRGAYFTYCVLCWGWLVTQYCIMSLHIYIYKKETNNKKRQINVEYFPLNCSGEEV